MLIAEVIVDVSSSEVDRVFDYYAGRDVLPGCRVLVPFGSKYIEGYVIRLKEKSDFALEKLKSILRPIDRYPVINAEMLELMDAMVAKYHLRKIDALRLFIPAEMRGGRVRELIRLFASMPEHIGDAILTYIKPSAKKQIELAEYLLAEGKAPVAAITKLFSPAALDALEKKGLVVITEEEIARKPYKDILYEAETVRLTAEQQNAVDAILNSGGGVHLLHGVTGSGKTEVYIRCISTLLDAGKTAIFMVPEISLTPQMLRYFRMRFGER
ncbi:MAG: DEAD/DEAH box helicase, partial [Firmicutes bacterium]|nr:DEAD/DEAH box helicase [Bacillota bacterium]